MSVDMCLLLSKANEFEESQFSVFRGEILVWVAVDYLSWHCCGICQNDESKARVWENFQISQVFTSYVVQLQLDVQSLAPAAHNFKQHQIDNLPVLTSSFSQLTWKKVKRSPKETKTEIIFCPSRPRQKWAKAQNWILCWNFTPRQGKRCKWESKTRLEKLGGFARVHALAPIIIMMMISLQKQPVELKRHMANTWIVIPPKIIFIFGGS